MQQYKDYQPSAWDSRANFATFDQEGINNIQDWYVCPVIKTRDASILSESNFDAILARLGGEGEKVEVHSFGHWACGWYELILVHPDLKDEVEKIEDKLDDYPVMNEDDYSMRVCDAAFEQWNSLSMRERLEYWEDMGQGHSIFSIRGGLPDWVDDTYSFVGE